MKSKILTVPILREGFSLLIISATVLFISSRPNPIPDNLISQIHDSDGPLLIVDQPKDRCEYSTIVRVTGSVTNGTQLVSGPTTLEVWARDWSGNESKVSRQLIPVSSGDISGFSVTSGNEMVTIQWDEVPGSESYSIFESAYGQKRAEVSSSYDWTDLENGQVYAFQVQSAISDSLGEDAYSSIIETISLQSSVTVLTAVTPILRTVRAAWQLSTYRILHIPVPLSTVIPLELHEE